MVLCLRLFLCQCLCCFDLLCVLMIFNLVYIHDGHLFEKSYSLGLQGVLFVLCISEILDVSHFGYDDTTLILIALVPDN